MSTIFHKKKVSSNSSKLCFILGGILLCTLSLHCSKERLTPTNDRDEVFVKFYGGSGDQYAADILEKKLSSSLDPGFLILGTTESFGDSRQVYLVETDTLGNILKEVTFTDESALNDEMGNLIANVQRNCRGVAMTLTAKGEVMIVSTCEYSIPQTNAISLPFDSKIFVIHYNLQTGERKEKRLRNIPFSGSEIAADVLALDNGDSFIVLGSTTAVDSLKEQSNYDPELDSTDISLIQVDIMNNSLNEKWIRTHGFKGKDKASSLHQLQDGGFAILGTTDSLSNQSIDPNSNSNNLLFFKTNQLGIPINAAVFGTENPDQAQSFNELDNDGFIITSTFTNQASNQVNTFKVSADLYSILHEEIYPNMGERVVDVYALSSTSYLLLGTQPSQTNGNQLILSKISDGNGNDFIEELETPGIYGGERDDISAKVIASQNGYAILGTFDLGANRVMGLVKTNQDGKLQTNE